MVVILLFFLILTLFLEGTVTTLPLVLLCLLVWSILRQDIHVFVAAFFAGLALDIFAVRLLGSTSLFFLIFIFLILLYQKKYEINSYPFMLVSSFFGSVGFLVLFGYAHVFEQALLSSMIAVGIFAGFRTPLVRKFV